MSSWRKSVVTEVPYFLIGIRALTAREMRHFHVSGIFPGVSLYDRQVTTIVNRETWNQKKNTIQ